MKCSYHATEESMELCGTCSKPLCLSCAHKIKGKTFCQDCLVRGAEWAAASKDYGVRLPADAPKRAALCAAIPGMGAVYNSDYLKGVTYFAVFAALVMMADRVHDVFGFGAFVFIIFTMFEAYRTAEARARQQLATGMKPETPAQDKSVMSWGIFLIALGFVFLLQNIIPFYFLNRLWPVVFIFLGAYLVYYYLRVKDEKPPGSPPAAGDHRDLY